MFVVAIGNAFDGIELHGPFEHVEEADQYGRKVGHYRAFHVIRLKMEVV